MKTGRMAFIDKYYWIENNFDANPDYQMCDRTKSFGDLMVIAKENNKAIHAMGGNKINKIIEEIRKLKSVDDIEILIEKIKRL